MIRIVDLFAGIGGLSYPFEKLDNKKIGSVVFASEFNDAAQKTYSTFHKLESNNDVLHGDITKIEPNEIKQHDLLLAGFPCQAFSIAGYRQGFDDEKGRGNLFFDILKILKAHKTPAFLLENVKNLKTHDSGKTFQRIVHELTALGYGVKAQVCNAKDYGLHQNRERIFIVGIREGRDVNKPCLPHPEVELMSPKKVDEWLSADANFEFEFPKEGKIQKLLEDFKLTPSKLDITLPDGRKATLFESTAPYFEKLNSREDWSNFIYNGKQGHFVKAVNYINSKIQGKNTFDFEDWDSNDDWGNDLGYQFIYQWRRKYVRRNKGGVCLYVNCEHGNGRT